MFPKKVNGYMENFLNKKDAAFYHITSPVNWELIKKAGRFIAPEGKIFVLRSCDERIISSLVIGQLLDTYTQRKFIVLKFPQNKNNFHANEIGIDSQSNEPTMPLQNIIYRKEISLSNIEFHDTIEYHIDTLTLKGNQFDNHKIEFDEFKESFDIKYIINNKAKRLIILDGLNNYKLIDYGSSMNIRNS